MKLRWSKKASSTSKKASEDKKNGGNSTGGPAPEVHDEDVFFDPHAWPESDGEDDFYSVNGELTPSRLSTPSRSRGNTPKHNALSPRTSFPKTNGASVIDADSPLKSEETPKTRFSTLLQEPQIGAAADSPVAPATNGGSLPSDGSEPGSSRSRRASSGRMSNGGKSGISLQCCIPGLGRSKRRNAIEKEDA